MVHDDGRVGLDGLRVCFDDERAVQHAGVALVATLADRLGIEASAAQMVRLRRERPGAANAGRKVMALLFAMVLGADSIDDCEVLRAGRTRRLLGGWVPAPSTLGTFLRAFTFGHVRQLDALLGQALVRAWRAGAGPGEDRLVVDVDSFIGRGVRPAQAGRRLRVHQTARAITRSSPRAPTPGRCCTSGCARAQANTLRGMQRFTEELIARVVSRRRRGRQAAARRLGILEQQSVRSPRAGRLAVLDRRANAARESAKRCDAIDENAWQPIADYPEEGEAQIAETVYGGRRLIVRCTRLVGAAG